MILLDQLKKISHGINKQYLKVFPGSRIDI